MMSLLFFFFNSTTTGGRGMQHRTGPAQNSRRQQASFDSCLPGEPTRKAPHLLQVAPRIGQRLRAGPGPRRLFSPTRCRQRSATASCQLRRTARAGSPLGPGRLAMTGRSYPASSPGRRHHESRPDSDMMSHVGGVGGWRVLARRAGPVAGGEPRTRSRARARLPAALPCSSRETALLGAGPGRAPPVEEPGGRVLPCRAGPPPALILPRPSHAHLGG